MNLRALSGIHTFNLMPRYKLKVGDYYRLFYGDLVYQKTGAFRIRKQGEIRSRNSYQGDNDLIIPVDKEFSK